MCNCKRVMGDSEGDRSAQHGRRRGCCEYQDCQRCHALWCHSIRLVHGNFCPVLVWLHYGDSDVPKATYEFVMRIHIAVDEL